MLSASRVCLPAPRRRRRRAAPQSHPDRPDVTRGSVQWRARQAVVATGCRADLCGVCAARSAPHSEPAVPVTMPS